jgi:glutathione S-transferase
LTYHKPVFVTFLSILKRSTGVHKFNKSFRMSDAEPLVFYDISSSKQPLSFAPNPSKTRLALGFKNVPFKTTWIDLPDIPNVRKELDCAATRKLDDGSDYYTLPMLRDAASGRVIGDSFDIANYLEDNFVGSGGSLFPEDSTGNGLGYESPHIDKPIHAPITTNQGAKNEAYAKFNLHVDATFSAYVILAAQNMPFKPETMEATKALFIDRMHLKSWDDLSVDGEAREQLKGALKEALKSLADLFMVHKEGPYLEGKRANYADLIVGGWLNYMLICLRAEERTELRTWHDGVFGRLHDALQEKYFVCT